jgi:hypothetical protein
MVIMFLALTVRADNLRYSGNTYLLGDVNGDGVVNIVDMSIVAVQNGATNAYPYGFGSGYYNPDADLNNDGVINIVDVTIVSTHMGQTSPWKLVNRDFEVINSTQYWGLFGMPAGNQEWTFDTKGHCKTYVHYIGVPTNRGGLHQGSMPFGWGNSPWAYTRIPTSRQMYVDTSISIDWAYVDWMTGVELLRLDVWFDIEAPGHATSAGCVSIVFDVRCTAYIPRGIYEGNIDGNKWIDYEAILGHMNDGIWYNFTSIDVNAYIAYLKNHVPGGLPQWQWISGATFYVRDVNLAMEVFEGHGKWNLDYLYFYAHD